MDQRKSGRRDFRAQVERSAYSAFSKDELENILKACDHFPSSHQSTGGKNAKRLRAFVLLLRYSGLRIGDALRLTDDPVPIKAGSRLIVPPHIIGHRIFLYTQKTGTNVYVPMPPEFFEALNEVEKLSQRYYFWSGNGKMETRIGNFERTLNRCSPKRALPMAMLTASAIRLLLSSY